MSILQTVQDFLADGDKSERAAFEAAMVKRIDSGEGFKMSDLIYEVYRCQAAIKLLSDKFDKLSNKGT